MHCSENSFPEAIQENAKAAVPFICTGFRPCRFVTWICGHYAFRQLNQLTCGAHAPKQRNLGQSKQNILAFKTKTSAVRKGLFSHSGTTLGSLRAEGCYLKHQATGTKAFERIQTYYRGRAGSTTVLLASDKRCSECALIHCKTFSPAD